MTVPLRTPASLPALPPGQRPAPGQHVTPGRHPEGASRRARSAKRRASRPSLVLPVALTAALLLTMLVARSPLVVAGSAPPGMRLRLPASYLVLAPFSDLLDALSLLSLRQHAATLLTVLALLVTWRLTRGATRLRGHLQAGVRAAAAVVGVYLVLTLVPRPMAAIRVDDRDLAVVDFHSHTSASHDGSPFFGARQTRAWHTAAGFDVGYVSDHGTFAGYDAAAPANPARAGDGTMLLRGLEVRCQGEHLVLLGAPSAIAVCDQRTLGTNGEVAILTLPGDIQPTHLLPPTRAVEVADAAPRALDQMARDGKRVTAIAHDAALAGVAGSNDHGWTRTAAAWSIVPLPGWRTLGAAALDSAIRARVTLGAASGIRVVERDRVIPPAGRLALAATVPVALWHMLRDLSLGERIAWLAWCWGAWLLLAARRRRSGDASVPAGDDAVLLPFPDEPAVAATQRAPQEIRTAHA